MKIRVIKIGRIAYPEIRQLGQMYEGRTGPLARPTQIESIELKDETGVERLLEKPASEHLVIALDERGQQWTSVDFAARLRQQADDPGVKSLTLLIGGPLGLSPELRRHARATWSLSQVTLTSDLAWVLLWEQLYRAFNILKGTAYHHA